MKKEILACLAFIILQFVLIITGQSGDLGLSIISLVFFVLIFILLCIFNSKDFKKWYIKKHCPNIYYNYFKLPKEKFKEGLKTMGYDDSMIECICTNKKIDDYRVSEVELELYLSYNLQELNELEKSLKNLSNREKKKSKQENSISAEKQFPEIKVKESEDDITREDIINNTVEFTEHGIYANKKVWDGVKYTMTKQRVYVYKRCYHLDMGELPRFHICRCSTMDNYIRENTLEIKYRKSNLPKVKVKDMDNNYVENEITHLPLCGNCYKIMKKQFSWLDSQMDNEDFIRNVINKVDWYKPNT